MNRLIKLSVWLSEYLCDNTNQSTHGVDYAAVHGEFGVGIGYRPDNTHTSLPFDVPTDVVRQVHSTSLCSVRKAKLPHELLAIFAGHRELEELYRRALLAGPAEMSGSDYVSEDCA